MPAPNTPTDLIDRIRSLERQVADLSGRMNIRPALNTIVGGSVTIKGGGQLIVEDSDGTDVLSIGAMSPDLNGQTQQSTIIRRMDGSLALAVHTTATTGSQTIRLYDRRSNIIFADDIDSAGGGLALPWLPIPQPVPDDVSAWANTTNATWSNLLRSRARLHHPKLHVRTAIGLSSGTSGQLRLVVDGTVALTGEVNAELNGICDVPGWDWTGSPTDHDIVIQGRRTAGTGNVYAQCRYIYGRQS
ncbi:hypothetical protein SEA_GALACTICA_24 [Streptomyces phage Galactica]|nr:hypothetical protein SEA_GALACTICA_24 [Streptomyces phage Galactica]